MRVALIHDWLTVMRGGERCLEAFCDLFPEADLFTLLHFPGTVSAKIEKHRIVTSFIQRFPFNQQAYRYYLPFFPLAIESFNLSGYDLILSSSHCVAKGVRVRKGSCHVAYLYTPMRYIWDQHEAYFGEGRSGWPARKGMRLFRPWLQRWDAASNNDVHAFIASSRHVAERIRRCYGRTADVIPPPVDFQAFSSSRRDDGFYLMVTAFAPYKRVDLAVEAFNRLKQPLKIIGTGQDEKRLKSMAGPTVDFLGWKSDSDIRDAYAACRAVVFPGEEDFGIVPLEAMASGKPVIAYGRGGVLETVIPLQTPGAGARPSEAVHPTGLFFYDPTPQALMQAVRYFESHRDAFDPDRIREHVRMFDRQQFMEKIDRYIQETYGEFKKAQHA
ncbi:MAG TPA: glycosyltransferase [Nitrospiria bacterium]|nr:glycosyltransferase [Nitrospiria bacterium]